MSQITYLEPDAAAIEKDFVDHWRIHNGEEFVGGFRNKEAAREFAERNNGTAIALLTFHNGEYIYREAEATCVGKKKNN